VANFSIGWRGFDYTKTVASYNDESDIITVEITPGSKFFQPRPGQYYFLYEPLSIRGYENHPMTTAMCIPVPFMQGDGEVSSMTSRTPTGDISAQPLLRSSEESYTQISLASQAPMRHRIVFWIRPYDGWTRRLRDKCKVSSNGRFYPWILPEGPYGHEIPLNVYDTTVFFAGGTGITASVPYLRDHSTQCSKAKTLDIDEEFGEEDSLSDPQRLGKGKMHLVWAAREPTFIRDVASQHLAKALSKGHFSADFYCTAWQDSQNEVVTSGPAPDPTSPVAAEIGEHAKSFHIFGGRPDIQSTILETATAAIAGNSRPGRAKIAVFVCGPQAMTRAVKSAVKGARTRVESECSIDFFDEAFTW
jgi:hypothetical protein